MRELTVGSDTPGYHAGKKANGRKRFIVTDTLGLLLAVAVVTASAQDRDGAKPALRSTDLVTGRGPSSLTARWQDGCSTGPPAWLARQQRRRSHRRSLISDDGDAVGLDHRLQAKGRLYRQLALEEPQVLGVPICGVSPGGTVHMGTGRG